ncbi:MAG: hypothetical protein ACLSBF_01715 [Alphaproteobacteria bacterium]
MPQSPSPTISSEGNEIRPQTAPVNSFHQSRAAAAPEQSASEEIDFNIDNYLDADENLPSLNKVPTDYNGGKNPQFIDEDDLDEAQAYGSDLPPYLTKKDSRLGRGGYLFYGNRHFPAYFLRNKKSFRKGYGASWQIPKCRWDVPAAALPKKCKAASYI